MNGIRQGEVYWIDFADRHPCVVVQGDLFNRSRITVVCLITSNMTRASAPGNVALMAGDANLPKESVVNVSQVLTVEKSELVEPENSHRKPSKRSAVACTFSSISCKSSWNRQRCCLFPWNVNDIRTYAEASPFHRWEPEDLDALRSPPLPVFRRAFADLQKIAKRTRD